MPDFCKLVNASLLATAKTQALLADSVNSATAFAVSRRLESASWVNIATKSAARTLVVGKSALLSASEWSVKRDWFEAGVLQSSTRSPTALPGICPRGQTMVRGASKSVRLGTLL